MDKLTIHSLEGIASVLDNLPDRNEVTISYDQMSGALVWSDEIPQSSALLVNSLWCLRLVFRFRTSLILGSPENEFREYWELAQKLFPNWPGFLVQRRSESLKPLLEKLKIKADLGVYNLIK